MKSSRLPSKNFVLSSLVATANISHQLLKLACGVVLAQLPDLGAGGPVLALRSHVLRALSSSSEKGPSNFSSSAAPGDEAVRDRGRLAIKDL